MMQEKRPFFVYGTLLPYQPNYYLLEKTIEQMQPAEIANCQLYDMGPYPMLVEQLNAKTTGMLITVSKPYYDKVMAAIDALEGFDPANPEASAYQRVEREVVVEDGRFFTAWVYLGNAQYVKDAQPISSGDWATHMKTNLQKISIWWETIETVAGLHEKR